MQKIRFFFKLFILLPIFRPLDCAAQGTTLLASLCLLPLGGMVIDKETQVVRDKPILMPIFPPQIPHEHKQQRTRASTASIHQPVT